MKVRATLTLRNALALEARERLGMTQAQVAHAIGITKSMVCAIETLRFRHVSDVALHNLAAFYCIKPEELIPLDLRKTTLIANHTIVREIPSTALLTAKSPIFIEDKNAPMEAEDLREAIDAALASLTNRQREAIQLAFGFDGKPKMTHEAIGTVLGISRERVRMTIQAGLRKVQGDREHRTLIARAAFGRDDPWDDP